MSEFRTNSCPCNQIHAVRGLFVRGAFEKPEGRQSRRLADFSVVGTDAVAFTSSIVPTILEVEEMASVVEESAIFMR